MKTAWTFSIAFAISVQRDGARLWGCGLRTSARWPQLHCLVSRAWNLELQHFHELEHHTWRALTSLPLNHVKREAIALVALQLHCLPSKPARPRCPLTHSDA
jgi:hypothetical protein